MAKKIGDSEFQGILNGLINDATDFVDSELSQVRATSTQYYQGFVPDLEDVEGRSKMRTRDVRDTVKAILPSILRVFTSSQNIVEFEPVGEDDIEKAKQATDYSNYVLMRDNDGFMILYSTFKDALVRRCGIVKAWWDEKERTITKRFTGLDEATLQMLRMEEDIEVDDIAMTTTQMMDQMGQMIDVPFYECKVTKKMKDGRITIMPVPPEELIVARTDRYIGESFVAHRKLMTVSDLVKMGYDRELCESKSGEADFDSNQEYLVRSQYNQYKGQDTIQNTAMRKVLYIESYAYIDRNGDGIAEHIKICTVGSDHEIVAEEEVDFHPFVAFPCDPEPHLSPLEGFSVAEDLLDIQKLKSAILRNTLDGLAQSLNPRTGIVLGQVNEDDVLNNEVGAIIRMKTPGAVMPYLTPDTSTSGLQMLAYADEIKESRTGISKAAMGLDPNALQSTAANAANAVVSASQNQTEMITRVLANGMRDLFKLLLKLMVTHQDQPRMIRLRNEFVQIDPRSWNADMDVTIDVALGTGTNAEKFNILAGITQKQELILQTLGPSNPIVSLAQYSNALAKMVELAGFKNTQAYVTKLPEDFQMPPAPPQVDPQAQAAELLAQVEREKSQARLQVDTAKLQAESQLKAAQLQLDRDKMEADFARKQLELEMQSAKLQAEIQIKEAETVLKQLTHVRGVQNEENAKANEEALSNAGQERQEGMLAQAVAALGQLIVQSQQQTARAMAAPKMIIRDEQGRVAGVQGTNEFEVGEGEQDD